MTARPRVVTDADVALLRRLSQSGSVVAASRSLRISRDTATYRLARLEEAFGGPVVMSRRGGRSFGGTRLTELGDRIIRDGFDSVELLDYRPVAAAPRSNVLEGVYHAGPEPSVTLEPHVALRVAFAAEEGEPVSLLLDPESILVARRRFPSSARNVVRATVVEAARDSSGSTLVAAAGSVRLRVAITPESVRGLHLARGAPVWLYVKATALRRVSRAPKNRETAPPPDAGLPPKRSARRRASRTRPDT